MSKQNDHRSDVWLADDEAAVLVEPLLAQPAVSVADLADSYENANPSDRRSPADLTTILSNSVFGRPEPAAKGRGAAKIGSRTQDSVAPRTSQTTPAGRGTRAPDPLARGSVASGSVLTQTPKISRPVVVPTAESKVSAAAITQSVEADEARRQRITVILASLFLLALVASVVVTVLGLGGAADGDTEVVDPNVEGTTQSPSTVAVTQPPTTEPPTTVPAPTAVAPPPTAPPTTQSTAPAPTTSAVASTSTEAPTTSAAPTTEPPTTDEPGTTAAPTTRRPTTQRPTTQTTALTIPDVTFSQPTWAGTEADAP
ncbi:MAG: hypothetical protein ACN4GZ_20615 [Acidimicrobiales bacterium]